MQDASNHSDSFPAPSDIKQIGRGFLMGAADIIPGVSGGTVALILGIYDRLVTALGRFDTTLLRHLQSRRWTTAAVHVDVRFLVFLGIGIVTGVGLFAGVVHYLLEQYLQQTFAAFFGLIAASSLIVLRTITRWSAAELVCLLLGAIFAIWLVNQPFLQHPPSGLWYVFLCGVVAICAMILPGISGAFILLILGMYKEMSELIKESLKGNVTGEGIVTIAVFVSGCLVGLLSFSKFLKWLLGRHESQTLAVLCGLMIGSLWKLWPWQRIVPGMEDSKKLITEHLPLQEISWDAHASWLVLIAFLSASAVLILDRMTAAHDIHPHLEQAEAEADAREETLETVES